MAVRAKVAAPERVAEVVVHTARVLTRPTLLARHHDPVEISVPRLFLLLEVFHSADALCRLLRISFVFSRLRGNLGLPDPEERKVVESVDVAECVLRSGVLRLFVFGDFTGSTLFQYFCIAVLQGVRYLRVFGTVRTRRKRR